MVIVSYLFQRLFTWIEADTLVIYWHSALLAARSNSSVVNTTSSLLSALTGSGDEGYILAQSLSRGFGSRSDKWGIEDIDDPWAINTQVGSYASEERKETDNPGWSLYSTCSTNIPYSNIYQFTNYDSYCDL